MGVQQSPLGQADDTGHVPLSAIMGNQEGTEEASDDPARCGIQSELGGVIDISTETLIPLRDAPRHLPARPNGKRVHVSACYRWTSRGVCGVRLEAIKIGGSTYTSIEALQRFAERLSGAGDQKLERLRVKTIARQQQIDRASARLADALKPRAGRRRS